MYCKKKSNLKYIFLVFLPTLYRISIANLKARKNVIKRIWNDGYINAINRSRVLCIIRPGWSWPIELVMTSAIWWPGGWSWKIRDWSYNFIPWSWTVNILVTKCLSNGYLNNLISDKIIKILKFIYYILHKKSNTFFTTGNDKLIDWSYFLAAGHIFWLLVIKFLILVR
jgi:hypothetical protein